MNGHPSAWAEAFARAHHLILRYEDALPGNVPGYKYDGPEGAVVVLDASLPDERQHFALAHEAAHILLNHTGEIEPEEEFEANRLAAELLLPTDDFAPDAWRGLRELKELFPHASFEAIARRRLAFVPGVLTVVDDGRMVRRLASDGFAVPARPTAWEWEAIQASFDTRADGVREHEGYRLAATYVDQGRGVVRVLLQVEEA